MPLANIKRRQRHPLERFGGLPSVGLVVSLTLS